MHSSPADRFKPRNSGIYGYMRNAQLIQKAPDCPIESPVKIRHDGSMTVSDYTHFIHQYVPRYHREETRKPKDLGKIAEYKEKLLELLDGYNAAAKREQKRQYATIKEFMVDHPLPPVAR